MGVSYPERRFKLISPSVSLNILRVKLDKVCMGFVYLFFIDFTLCPWQREGRGRRVFPCAAANVTSLGQAEGQFFHDGEVGIWQLLGINARAPFPHRLVFRLGTGYKCQWISQRSEFQNCCHHCIVTGYEWLSHSFPFFKRPGHVRGNARYILLNVWAQVTYNHLTTQCCLFNANLCLAIYEIHVEPLVCIKRAKSDSESIWKDALECT